MMKLMIHGSVHEEESENLSAQQQVAHQKVYQEYQQVELQPKYLRIILRYRRYLHYQICDKPGLILFSFSFTNLFAKSLK